MDTVTIVEVVRALAWGGSVGLVLWVASHYGDQWPWYKALDAGRQRLVTFLAAGAISIAAYAALTYVPDSAWVFLQPYFTILVVVASGVFGSQAVYLFRRAPALISDMNKIRSTGMIVPDDHPMRALMQDRVRAEASGIVEGVYRAAPVTEPAANPFDAVRPTSDQPLSPPSQPAP